MRAAILASFILAVCFATSLYVVEQQHWTVAKRAGGDAAATPEERRSETGATGAASTAWSAKVAAAHLDGRMTWWIGWPVAARDHGTFCVSCHTVLSYALARPALRAALHEQAPSPNERKLLDNVTKRARMWKEVEPYYSDEKRGVPKTTEWRGTESILNALILVSYDAGKLSPDARWRLTTCGRSN